MSQFSISPITQGRYSYVSPPQPQTFGQMRPHDAQNSFYNNRTNSSHCSNHQSSLSPRGKVYIQMPMNASSPTHSNRFIQPLPFTMMNAHQLDASPSPIRTTYKSKNNSLISVSVNSMNYNQVHRDVSPSHHKQSSVQNLPPKTPGQAFDPRVQTHSPNNRHQQMKPQQQPYVNLISNSHLQQSTANSLQISGQQQKVSGSGLCQNQNSYMQSKRSLGNANLLQNDQQSDHSLISSRDKTFPMESNCINNIQQNSTSLFSLEEKTQPSTRKQLLSQMNNLKDLMCQHQEKENRALELTPKSQSTKTYQQLSTTIVLLHSEIDRIKLISQQENHQQLIQIETLKQIINELQDKSEQLLTENGNLNCALKEEESLILELQEKLQQNHLESITDTQGPISESFINEHEKLIDKFGQLQQSYQQNERQLSILMKENEKLRSEAKYQSKSIDLPRQPINQYRESGKLVEAIQDLQQEIELWKEKYLEADRKNEEMPMLEINLKNTQTTIVDLENRIKFILQENEKLKIMATQKLQIQQKVQNMTKEQNKLISDAQESDSQLKQQRSLITQLESKVSELEVQAFHNKNLRVSMQEFEVKIKQQISLNEQLRNKMEEKDQQISSLRHQNHKIKDLDYMVDCFQQEQDNFLNNIKEKQNEIEQLKLKLIKNNELEIKLKNSQQEFQQVFVQLQDKLFNLEEETSRRSQVEDYCNQLKQQINDQEASKYHIEEDLSFTKQESSRLSSVCEIIKNQYIELQQEQEISKLKTTYLQEQLKETKQQLTSSQEDFRQEQQNQQNQHDLLHQQKQQLNNNQNDKQQMQSVIDQQNASHQIQLQDLKRQLDLWFRSQIEIEIRGAMGPIMDQKNRLDEQIILMQQKYDVQDKRLKSIIDDQELLLKQKREIEFMNEQFRQKQIGLEKQKEERELDMNEKDLMFDKLSQKYQEREREYTILVQKYRLLNQELQEMKEWNVKYQNSFIDSKEANFNAERVAFETHITQLKEKLIQYENSNSRLAEENDRIGLTLQEKNIEIDTLSNDLILANQLYQEQVEGIKREMDKYRNNQDDSDTNKLRMESQKQQQDSHIKQLSDSLRNYKEEQEKLYILMSKRKDEQDLIVKQLEEKKKEIQRVIKANIDLQTTHRQANDKIDQLQREVDDLCRNREDYRQQSERYSIEVTKKNKELVQKIEELNVLKCKYEEAICHLQDLESTLIIKLQNKQ